MKVANIDFPRENARSFYKFCNIERSLEVNSKTAI